MDEQPYVGYNTDRNYLTGSQLMDPSRVFTLVDRSLCARGTQSLVSGKPGIEAIGVATVGPDMFAQMQAAAPDMVIVETGGEDRDRLVAQALDSVPDVRAVGLTFADEWYRGQRDLGNALRFAPDPWAVEAWRASSGRSASVSSTGSFCRVPVWVCLESCHRHIVVRQYCG